MGLEYEPKLSNKGLMLHLCATVRRAQGPAFFCWELQTRRAHVSTKKEVTEEHQERPSSAPEAVRSQGPMCTEPSSVPGTSQAKTKKSRCAYRPWGSLCVRRAAQPASAAGIWTSARWGGWGRRTVWCPCPLSWKRGKWTRQGLYGVAAVVPLPPRNGLAGGHVPSSVPGNTVEGQWPAGPFCTMRTGNGCL